MKYSMTFGQMPTREQYDAAWEDMCASSADPAEFDNLFRFGNDKRVGTCALTPDELWDELQLASEKYEKLLGSDELAEAGFSEDYEELGSWLSSVLGCLGIEWI